MAELKDTVISGSLRVTGDLTVTGSIVEEVRIKDKLVEIDIEATDTGSLDGAGFEFGNPGLKVPSALDPEKQDTVHILYRSESNQLEITPSIRGLISSASHAAEVNWEGVTGKAIYEGRGDIRIADVAESTRSVEIYLEDDLEVLGLQSNVGLLKNHDVIPSGSSLYNILSQILQKVLYPGVATQPSISQTLQASFNNGAVLEFGTVISRASVTVSTNNGSYNCYAGQQYEEIGKPVVSWSNYVFGNLTVNGTEVVGGTVSGNRKAWDGLTYRVKIGSNSVNIASSTADNVTSNLPKLNTGRDYVPSMYGQGGAGEAACVSSGTRTAGARNVTCTGVWPCFTNIRSGAFTASPDTKLNIQTSATFQIDVVPTEVGSANNFKFAYPEGYSVSSFKIKNLDGTWVDFAAVYYKDAGTVTKTLLDGSTKTYHYLTTDGGNGAGSYRVVLNKQLNN